MPKTREELATRALVIINRAQAGQTPNPEDLASVDSVIDPLLAQLGIDEVVYVGDADAIDDQLFLPLARRLALEIGPDFGLPAPDDAALNTADGRIRRLTALRTYVEPIRAEYF